MPFYTGSKPEQVPSWGQIRALFNLRWLRMWFPAVYTIDQLRNTRFMLARIVIISDSGKMGILFRDDSDTTTADDGQDCIVTADDVPIRFKRRTILRKYTPTSGTDTTMETGSMVYDADFLHVKTTSSTIEKIPFQLQTNGIRVATTNSGGASDSGYWTKIASVASTSLSSDLALSLSCAIGNTAYCGSTTIRLFARSTNNSPYSYGLFYTPIKGIQTVRIVRVTDLSFDIWIQKSSSYSRCSIALLGVDGFSHNLTWYKSAAWVSAHPVETYVEAVPESGTGSCTTATRPTMVLSALMPGYNIWDSTISKQIFWNGTSWRDAQGAAV